MYPLGLGFPSLLRLCESKKKTSLPHGITAIHNPVMEKIEPVLSLELLKRQCV